jgi:hypothetical protein
MLAAYGLKQDADSTVLLLHTINHALHTVTSQTNTLKREKMLGLPTYALEHFNDRILQVM